MNRQNYIRLARQAEEFYTKEKCYIKELSNSADDPQLSIARARVEPGVTTRWHRLKGTCERYLIASGLGVVEIDDQTPTEVSVGDVVIIPPMSQQRIKNIGTEDLIFYAICTPRYSDDSYEDID